MQGKWVRNTGRYASGEFYKIGKIKVGSWFNPTVSKGQPQIYRAVCDLPGITLKEGTTDFATAEEAKARLERAVATWFRWLDEEPSSP